MQAQHHALGAAIVLLFAAASATAQSSDTLKAAAEKAVATNPEVTARFNAFRAAGDAVDVARGGWRPRVDLNASAGRDSDRIRSRDPASQTLNRTGVGLSLTQLLWDGLATNRESDRLGNVETEIIETRRQSLDRKRSTALEDIPQKLERTEKSRLAGSVLPHKDLKRLQGDGARPQHAEVLGLEELDHSAYPSLKTAARQRSQGARQGGGGSQSGAEPPSLTQPVRRPMRDPARRLFLDTRLVPVRVLRGEVAGNHFTRRDKHVIGDLEPLGAGLGPQNRRHIVVDDFDVGNLHISAARRTCCQRSVRPWRSAQSSR